MAIVAAGPGRPGGQAVQARLLAEGLRREGYEAWFLPIDPVFPVGLRWLRRFPLARTLLNQALYLSRLPGLRRADVVHVFSASYWSFLLSSLPAILAARGLGKRAILHYHSGEAEDHLARWGPLVHPWLRRADAIAVPSEYLRRVFERHGYRARVIPNVVDTSRFRFRDRVPLRPRLLSTRNLERHYRVDQTLEAYLLVKQRFPEATLTIAGAGSEEARLRRLAASVPGGGVRFAGAVGAWAVPFLYDRSDIFVNSSVVDNQPVSILEAFAAGLPVVSTPSGDIPFLVRDCETGVLVPPGNPAATARAVTGLLEDGRRAALMAWRAREYVERHRWTRVRESWAALYSGAGA